MAELDPKLLQNLDKTLNTMNSRLVTLEQTLAGVKEGMQAAFDPTILKSWQDAMRGMRAARLIDAEQNIGDISKIKGEIELLKKEVDKGMKFKLFSPAEMDKAREDLAELQAIINELNKMSRSGMIGSSDVTWLAELRGNRESLKKDIAMGGSFSIPLSEEELRQKIDLLAQYKREYDNIMKGSEQRTLELTNVKKQEAKADESIFRQAIANRRQQINIENQIAKIEHDRQIRTKTGSEASAEQIKAETQLYKALKAELRSLRKEMTSLEEQREGVKKQATASLKPYQQYSSAKEELRYLKELERQQNKNIDVTKKQDEALHKMTMTADRLKNALVAAFGITQIKNFVSNVVKVRGEFEMAEVALTNIIGNSEKASMIWKKTMNLAVNSPLTAQQLTRYTKQLAAFRIETSKLYDTTKMLADVSVGLGVDMERLILAYGHTKSSGFLRGMYARQFATAGVNIYGELADYYTKMEGQLVTFRDVYERISKKLVSFADVEKVFEKITGEGGVFYNMQQKLSDTVQGQINKIKDSWQQALNDIGKSEQGVIRNITGIVLSIVKNWRMWLSVIEATTAAIITFKATNIVRALISTSYAANAASVSTARLAKAFKALGASFVANWPAMAIAAAVAAVTALVTAFKHMKDYNEELDKQSVILYDAQQKMYDYQKRIEHNNAVLSDATASEEDLKSAREDNMNVLNAIGKEYPELAEDMKLQENGEVNLTKKIEAHNEALREQIRLNEKLKQKSIFDDPFETDTRQYFEQLDEWRKKIQNIQQELKIKLLRGEINKDENPIVEALLGINTDDILNAVKEYNLIIHNVRSILNSSEQELEQAYTNAIRQMAGDPTRVSEQQELHNRLLNLRKYAIESTNLVDVAGLPLIETNTHATDEFKKESDAVVKDLIQSFEIGVRSLDEEQKLISEKYNQNFASYLKENGGRLKDMVETNTLDVNEVVRTFLEKNGQALTDANKKVWNDILNEAIFGADKAKKILDLQLQLYTAQDPFVRNAINKQIQAVKDEYYDFFASFTPESEGGEDNEQTTKKNLSELLTLLKTMNSEYNKLSKSAYGYAKSQKEVMRVFQESFKDIFGYTIKEGDLEKFYTLLDFNKLDITSKQGLANAFQQLHNVLSSNPSLMAELFGKDADFKKILAKLQKEIDTQEVEIGMDVQVRNREEFAKELEKMFSDYELTIDLQKLNVSESAAKDWLGIDYTSLGEMLDKMNEFADKQIKKGNFDEEDAKMYQQWAKKVEDRIYKERREKAKEYSKYLEQEFSDRAKLEMDYAKKVADVKASSLFEGEQKETILANMEKEYNDAIQELTWKSFKESDFYVEMMDDLTSIPAEYSALMLTKLNEILMHPDKLSPRALKEAINARQKVMEARRQMNPLMAIRENAKAFRAFFTNESNKEEFGLEAKTWKQAQKEIDQLIIKKTKELGKLDDELQIYDDLIGEIENYNRKKEEYETKSQGLEGDEQEEIDVRQEQLDQLKEEQELYEQLSDAKQNEESVDEAELDRLTKGNLVREQKIKQLQIEIDAYQQAKEARMGMTESYAGLSQNAQTLVGGGEITIGGTEGITSGNIAANRRNTADKKNSTKSALQRLKDAKKNTEEWRKAWHEFTSQLNDTIGKVKNMGNAFYDTYEALGGETDALTEGWKEFGNTMVDVITQALEMIPTLVTGFTAAGVAINSAMGIIGLIAEAIQLVLTLIGALAKLHDAGQDKLIEEQQQQIDNLTKAYERLERQIEKTWSTISYMQTYEQMVDNLKKQQEALRAQMEAEEGKKKSDADKIRDYKNSIDDIDDQLEDLKQDYIEVFGGLGEVNYRSAAQEFVSAWKEAFLETGDGLQGLQDHFNEFLQEWFVKQATMRIAGRMLEPLFSQIDRAVDQYGTGGTSVLMSELNAIREKFAAISPRLSDALEALAGQWGLEGEGGLSGLAAGIQGMTEEQANILEAYWNSVRGYTASIDMNVSRIVELLGAGGVNTNPMLEQLSTIALNTGYIPRIYNMLEPMQTNEGSGRGLRTYAM